jgi:capsular polysaccharide transport system permease protein
VTIPTTPPGSKAGQPAQQPAARQQGPAAAAAPATQADAAAQAKPQAATGAPKPGPARQPSPPADPKPADPKPADPKPAAPQAAAPKPAAPQDASPARAQRPFQGQQGLGAKPQDAQPQPERPQPQKPQPEKTQPGPAAAQPPLQKPPAQKPPAQPRQDQAQDRKPAPQPQKPASPASPQSGQQSGQQSGPQPGQAARAAQPAAPADPKPPALRQQDQPIPVRPMAQPAAKPAPKPAAKPAAKPLARVRPQQPAAAPDQPVRPTVGIAEPRRRHWLILGSFLALVLLPSLLWAAYLWLRAEDQYVSTVGFSVRKEQSTPSIDLLGGLAPLAGGASASDTDILYEYIRSQDMVERIDARLDLRARFSGPWPHDFVFAFDPEGHVEDLTDYWQRQVKVLYDSTTQLITLKISAFTARDAQEIAAAVFQESSDKINQLSTIAQDDATRLAKAELDKARAELTETRQAMTAFRMRSQIVDPEADLAGQMGVLSGLQAQLAEVLVAHDLLLDNAQPTDHRVTQSQQKIDALRRLIDAERAKFGAEGKGPAGESYAQLMAEYEKLAVDREFAEGAYRSARIAHETALAEAQRQARYLAAHIEPKVAQSATEPNRPWLWAMITGMLLAGWSILVLIYYSVRDRR